jgi:hypothetical protein
MQPYFLLALALGIVVLQCFLVAMFRREAVKRDLYERGCRPIRIWWRVFAWWAPNHATPFRAVYSDRMGSVHTAYCWVRQDLFGPAIGPRRVRWVKDEVTCEFSSPEA